MAETAKGPARSDKPSVPAIHFIGTKSGIVVKNVNVKPGCCLDRKAAPNKKTSGGA